MAYETIKYEIDEQILTITLNRPDKLNAFNATMQAEMIAAFDAADEDDNVRAIIVTGAGRGFCAGADLRPAPTPSTRDARRGPVKRAGRRQGRLQRSAGARRRRPGDAAHLQMPETRDRGDQRPGGRHRRHHAAADGYPHRLGERPHRLRVLPARHRARGGSSWFLPRLVGIAQALEWCYTGRVFPAQEALAGRLVSRSCRPTNCCRPRVRWPRRSPTNRAGIGGADPPDDVAHARRRRSDGSPQGRQPRHLCARPVRGRQGRRGVVPGKRPAVFKNKVSSDMPDYFPWWDEREYK